MKNYPKEENREYVRKVLGYTITGDTKARKFFHWYGYGSNGKTQIFKLLNINSIHHVKKLYL